MVRQKALAFGRSIHGKKGASVKELTLEAARYVFDDPNFSETDYPWLLDRLNVKVDLTTNEGYFAVLGALKRACDDAVRRPDHSKLVDHIRNCAGAEYGAASEKVLQEDGAFRAQLLGELTARIVLAEGTPAARAAVRPLESGRFELVGTSRQKRTAASVANVRRALTKLRDSPKLTDRAKLDVCVSSTAFVAGDPDTVLKVFRAVARGLTTKKEVKVRPKKVFPKAVDVALVDKVVEAAEKPKMVPRKLPTKIIVVPKQRKPAIPKQKKKKVVQPPQQPRDDDLSANAESDEDDEVEHEDDVDEVAVRSWLAKNFGLCAGTMTTEKFALRDPVRNGSLLSDVVLECGYTAQGRDRQLLERSLRRPPSNIATAKRRLKAALRTAGLRGDAMRLVAAGVFPVLHVLMQRQINVKDHHPSRAHAPWRLPYTATERRDLASSLFQWLQTACHLPLDEEEQQLFDVDFRDGVLLALIVRALAEKAIAFKKPTTAVLQRENVQKACATLREWQPALGYRHPDIESGFLSNDWGLLLPFFEDLARLQHGKRPRAAHPRKQAPRFEKQGGELVDVHTGDAKHPYLPTQIMTTTTTKRTTPVVVVEQAPVVVQQQQQQQQKEPPPPPPPTRRPEDENKDLVPRWRDETLRMEDYLGKDDRDQRRQQRDEDRKERERFIQSVRDLLGDDDPDLPQPQSRRLDDLDPLGLLSPLHIPPPPPPRRRPPRGLGDL